MPSSKTVALVRFPAVVALVVVAVRAVAACSPTPAEAPAAAPTAAPTASEPAAKDSHSELDAGGPKEKWLAADGATVFEREITAKRSDQEVQAVLHENTKTIRKCYQAALPKNPALAGRVNVRFTIRPDGKVENAKDEQSSLPSAGVVNCVLLAVGKLKFPAVKDATTTIVYPFVFEPGN